MLRIGEFAWLAQVTTRTLRHYDEIGLLKPLCVDPFTGYRYYSLAQLPRLNRILALKDLGLSLEEIAPMLDEDLSPEEIRGMLRLKQAELESQMREVQARLARVKTRLQQIEMEGQMPAYDVVIKAVEMQWIASVRETISSWEQDVVGPALYRTFHELENYLTAQGTEPSGPGMTIWHDSHGGTGETALDVEAAMPIGRPMPGGDRIGVRELPRAQVAYVVHHGRYEDLPVAKRALFSWVGSNGYRLSAPVREIYLHYDPAAGPNGKSPNHVTEVQFPIEKEPHGEEDTSDSA